MRGGYEWPMVLMTAIIAVLSSFATFSFASRVARYQGMARRMWLGSGAVVLAVGIWATNLAGMMSLSMPIVMQYSHSVVWVSFVFCLGASWLALSRASLPHLDRPDLATCGFLLGFAMAGMLYLSIAALDVDGQIAWRTPGVLASVLSAMLLSTASVYIFFCSPGLFHSLRARYLGASAVLAAAMLSSHFLGTSAALFYPFVAHTRFAASVAVSAPLAFGVAAGALLVMAVALMTTYLDRYVETRRKEAATLRRFAQTQEFIAESSGTLASSIGYEDTIRAVASTLVPMIADICALDLVATGSETERVIVERSPSVPPSVATVVLAHAPFHSVQDFGVRQALESGRSILVRETSVDFLSSIATSPEHLATLLALGFSSYVVVPLKARGMLLGTLLLAYYEGRSYEPADVAIIESLAHRSAIAIDNARLMKSAEEATAAANEANKAKSEFLAMMSHELRTPLNAIAGYAQLLLMGIRGPLNETQSSDLVRIEKSQQHLLALVNDILNFARLEAGTIRFAPRPVDVADLVSGATVLLLPQIGAKGLRLVVTPPMDGLTALVDSDRAHQVLVNLLTNAVKFTRPGDTISVLWDVSGPSVELKVCDTGIGIPADRLEAVFEPFYQVDRHLYSTTEGVGLGLAISRDIARAMGGDLKAMSSPGASAHHTVFTFTMPRFMPSATAPLVEP